MKRIIPLLGLLLCLTALFACGTETDPSSAAPADTEAETVPLEISQYGYTLANPERTYEYPDDRPVFSLEGSFYDGPILVELLTARPATVRYTLDGTEPEETSALYDPDGLYLTAQEASDFTRALTVKARAWYDDGTVSQVAAHTYFLAPGVTERFSTVVVSISGDPAVLTEGPDGIFYGENYNNRGDATEREVYIAAWDADGNSLFAQYAGIRIYGGASRSSSIKSTKLYARKRYSSGIGSFRTDIFGTEVADGSGDTVAKYDKLVLRNAGNDFQFSFIRDELCQTLAKNAGFDDYEAVVPAVVYLNGEYYGLFWLHESYCDDYFKNKYPNDSAQGEFVVVEGTETWKDESDEGELDQIASAYNMMYSTYAWADLTKESVYRELLEEVDVENYLRYFAFNIYINNWDWPQNNYKCYRYVPAEGEALGEGVYDGRWRYLLHDTDFSLGLYGWTETSASYNNIRLILDPDSDRYAPLFAALMRRADCREYFLNYLTELSEGALSSTNVCATLEELQTLRSREMEYYYQHLDDLRQAGDSSIWTNAGVLEENLAAIRTFASRRAPYVLSQAEKALAQFE